MKDVIARAYRKSKRPGGVKEQMVNYNEKICARFINEEISGKNRNFLPEGTQAKVDGVYQTLEGLQEASNHTGDWYFSGDYPTAGWWKLVNKAFIDYIENIYQF